MSSEIVRGRPSLAVQVQIIFPPFLLIFPLYLLKGFDPIPAAHLNLFLASFPFPLFFSFYIYIFFSPSPSPFFLLSRSYLPSAPRGKDRPPALGPSVPRPSRPPPEVLSVCHYQHLAPEVSRRPQSAPGARRPRWQRPLCAKLVIMTLECAVHICSVAGGEGEG